MSHVWLVGRTALACALVLVTASAEAQSPRSATSGAVTARPRPSAPRAAVPLVADASEIPAGEHDAQVLPLGATLPRCLDCPAPVWPTPVTQRWRFRVQAVVDDTGKVRTARIVQTLVGDPKARPVGAMGDVVPALAATPDARAGLAVLAAVRQWRLEPPAVAPLLLVTDVGVSEDVALASPGASAKAAARKPIRVGGDIPPPRKLVDVPPVYPPDALAARITGTVVIDAVISPEGDVTSARVVKGVPMLDEAALAAVRQWKYTPTLIDGVAVPVIVTVTSRFSLQ
ncbi:hypothetical protein TBR22_A22550 [Luteitalea sp. TBR-22]|uniref:energy transducer TonB n=1 Tax=Luteitalea sp. TBR-22 TaxID=2802971 RepID=UPI001AF2DAA4|nr:energy transducer TonB [Luteitalea sp. TBR-22]BCS33030.1 hypothetical protein TBR22_A22550 [Luteitalea sp. TBR-22]